MLKQSTCVKRVGVRATGFTLIELLVVIAIIALLVALLFPVFLAARARSHKAVCLSNLRQIGMAFRMYRDDFEHRPPEITDLYPQYVSSAKVFQCPRDNWIRQGGWAWAAWGKHVTPPLRRVIPTSYGYFFTPKILQPDRDWDLIEESPYPAGYLVCVLHGDPDYSQTFFPGDAPYFQGQYLRLVFSGAVVTRQYKKRFDRNAVLTQ